MSQLMFLTAGDRTDVQGETDTGADVSDRKSAIMCIQKGFHFIFFPYKDYFNKSFMGVCTENHVSVSVYSLLPVSESTL